MTDLELTHLCAAAIGLKIAHEQYGHAYYIYHPSLNEIPVFARYDPLHDKAQAFELVERFRLSVGFSDGWGCVKNDDRGKLLSGAYHYPDLPRAIVECVAKMQQANG